MGKVTTTICAALALTGLLGLSACGDDDDEKAGAAKSLSVSIDASNKLTGVKTVEGGAVRVGFANRSKLPYDLQLVRVDGNQTARQVLAVIASDEDGQRIPDWLHGAGGVGTLPPGQSSSSTQVLRPGRYFAVAGPDTEGRGPRPRTAAFEVEGGGGGSLPATEARIDGFEYGFRASGLKAGRNQVTFRNTGRELHHAIAAPLAPGKTVADVKRFFQTEKGRPPVDFEKSQSTVVLDGGVSQVVEMDLQKGKYAMVCFIPDRAGGPPHIAKGMISEVTVS